MNQQPKHTEPTTNSYAAAYGYEYMYDGLFLLIGGFGGFMQELYTYNGIWASQLSIKSYIN